MNLICYHKGVAGISAEPIYYWQIPRCTNETIDYPDWINAAGSEVLVFKGPATPSGECDMTLRLKGEKASTGDFILMSLTTGKVVRVPEGEFHQNFVQDSSDRPLTATEAYQKEKKTRGKVTLCLHKDKRKTGVRIKPDDYCPYWLVPRGATIGDAPEWILPGSDGLRDVPGGGGIGLMTPLFAIHGLYVLPGDFIVRKFPRDRLEIYSEASFNETFERAEAFEESMTSYLSEPMVKQPSTDSDMNNPVQKYRVTVKGQTVFESTNRTEQMLVNFALELMAAYRKRAGIPE